MCQCFESGVSDVLPAYVQNGIIIDDIIIKLVFRPKRPSSKQIQWISRKIKQSCNFIYT